jgi:tungstate transport system ATP-binding protein
VTGGTSEAAQMKTILEACDLVVRRGGQVVLDIARLELLEGEVLAVIGPNGAGKSSLLMTLSQLLTPDQGRLLYQGEVLSARDTLRYRRKIGMVLQDPLLLDTTVFNNVAAGLRFRGMSKAEIQKRAAEWLERLGIGHLRQRVARTLSGGEAQRVSLARALALRPEILFLDEPFSALDAPTRASLQADLQKVLAEAKVTTVLITHDLNEALMLGDRVAVMFDSNIRQIGTPEEVFTAPSDPQIARLVGVETIIPGRVLDVQDGLATIGTQGVRLEAVGDVTAGQSVLLCLRPEDVTLWIEKRTEGSSARNCLEGRITGVTPQGPLERVVVDCGFPLVALVTRASAREMELTPGKTVSASFKASAAQLIIH